MDSQEHDSVPGGHGARNSEGTLNVNNLLSTRDSNQISNMQTVRSELRYKKLTELVYNTKKDDGFEVSHSSKIKGIQMNKQSPIELSRITDQKKQHFSEKNLFDQQIKIQDSNKKGNQSTIKKDNYLDPNSVQSRPQLHVAPEMKYRIKTARNRVGSYIFRNKLVPPDHNASTMLRARGFSNNRNSAISTRASQ